MTNVNPSTTHKRTFRIILIVIAILILIASALIISKKPHTTLASSKYSSQIKGHHITILSRTHHTMKIKLDQSDFKSAEFSAGDRKKYDASSRIELMVDSPKDIELTYNGKEVKFSPYQKELHLMFP